MKIFRKVYEFFAKPFKEDFIFLFIMALLVCGPRFVFHSYVQYQGWSTLIWETAHSYLLCYFVALAIQLIPNKLKKLYKYSFNLLAFIDFCIDTACIIVTRNPFYNDHVAIVMGTNLSEGKEFINTYVTFTLLWIILFAVVLICLLYKDTRFINYLGRQVALIATVLSVSSCAYFIFKGSNTWECRFYNKIVALLLFETPPDLRPYQHKLDLDLSNSSLPDNVILILGESFSKSHSQMYGYEKNTNPCLRALANDSLLITYKNATAPALHTIDCVKAIMSTYKMEYKDSVNWYECITLPNIMRHCGYSTTWISNQSPSGVFDNIATRYSELCDTSIFVGNTMKGVGKTDFDEDIIPKLHSIVERDKNFLIIHLMGSHLDYKMRYPEKWHRFQVNDYPKLNDSQKSVIASYDNSILYNDYVVNEILKYFESKETLALYFSDHGQDLFDSSEDYFGHAITSDSLSAAAAVQVPFFVYMSSKYQMNFPNETEGLKAKSEVPINTESTIRFICDALGVELKPGEVN